MQRKSTRFPNRERRHVKSGTARVGDCFWRMNANGPSLCETSRPANRRLRSPPGRGRVKPSRGARPNAVRYKSNGASGEEKTMKHLKGCRECQSAVTDYRTVDRRF